jgi:hypothetical protein
VSCKNGGPLISKNPMSDTVTGRSDTKAFKEYWSLFKSCSQYISETLSWVSSTATAENQRAVDTDQALAEWEIKFAVEADQTDPDVADGSNTVATLTNSLWTVLDLWEDQVVDDQILQLYPVPPGKYPRLRALSRWIEQGRPQADVAPAGFSKPFSADPKLLKDRVTAFNQTKEQLIPHRLIETAYRPQELDSKLSDVINAIRSNADFHGLSHNLFAALVNQTSCCAVNGHCHVARVQLDFLSHSNSSGRVNLDMFCSSTSLSNERERWHELRVTFTK